MFTTKIVQNLVKSPAFFFFHFGKILIIGGSVFIAVILNVPVKNLLPHRFRSESVIGGYPPINRKKKTLVPGTGH